MQVQERVTQIIACGHFIASNDMICVELEPATIVQRKAYYRSSDFGMGEQYNYSVVCA